MTPGGRKIVTNEPIYSNIASSSRELSNEDLEMFFFFSEIKLGGIQTDDEILLPLVLNEL